MNRSYSFGCSSPDEETLEEITTRFKEAEQRIINEGYVQVTPFKYVSYHYYDSSSWNMECMREETDAEYEYRVNQAKQIEENKKQQRKDKAKSERVEYERLKKKFEPKEKAGN